MSLNYTINAVQKRLVEFYKINIISPEGRLQKHKKVIDPIVRSLDGLQYKAVIKACNKALEKPLPATQTCLRLFKAIALFFDTEEKAASLVILREKVCKDGSAYGLGDLSVLKFLDTLCPVLLPPQDLIDACDKAASNNLDNVELTLFALNVLLSRRAFEQASALAYTLHQARSSVEYVNSCSGEAKLQAGYMRKRYILWSISSLLMHNPSTAQLDQAETYLKEYVTLKASINETETPSNPPFAQSLDIYGPGRKDVDYELAEFMCRTKLLEIRSKIGAVEARRGLLALMDNEQGRDFRNRHLGLELWFRDLSLLYGGQKDLQALFESMCESLKGGDGNWHTIDTMIQACWKLEALSEYIGICLEKARLLLQSLSLDPNLGRERGYALGLVVLARDTPEQLTASLDLIPTVQQYFDAFGSKICCAEDLAKTVALLTEDQKTTLLQTMPSNQTATTAIDLYRMINQMKLRHILGDKQVQPMQYVSMYIEHLALGADLPKTDLQPADDLALFAVEAWLTEAAQKGKSTEAEALLMKAACLCELGIAKSPYKFQFRILLIQLYRLLGAPSLALQHYQSLNPKQIQNDSISHYLLDRASSFSLAFVAPRKQKSAAPVVDNFKKTILFTNAFYTLADRQAIDASSRIWNQLSLIKHEEYSEFSGRIEHSIARAHTSIESYRQQTITSGTVQDLPIELQDVILATSENRDFTLLEPSILSATACGPRTGAAWNCVMAKLHFSLFTSELGSSSTFGEGDISLAKEELSKAEQQFLLVFCHLHAFAGATEAEDADREYKSISAHFEDASSAILNSIHGWNVLHEVHLLVEAYILLCSVADGESDLVFADTQRKISKAAKRLKPLTNNIKVTLRKVAAHFISCAENTKSTRIMDAVEELNDCNCDLFAEDLAQAQKSAAKNTGKAMLALLS